MAGICAPAPLQKTFIARQPILDRRQQVHGYELLYRSGPTDAFDGEDPDGATLQLMSASLLVHNLQELVGGLLGYVNVPRKLLVEDMLLVLPVQHTVVEILETVEPDAEVVEAVRRLKAAGMRIALDDFVGGPGYDELVELADVIKVDFLQSGPEERKRMVDTLRRPGRLLLAEKVETREVFQEALDCGYDLFQGYFFCRPETRSRREIPKAKVHYVQLLREIARPELDLARIEAVIKREVSLSAKLLRYLSSVEFGLRVELDSIRSALVHLGERPLRRWVSLVAMGGLGEDKPGELVRLSLVRARLCESLAERLTAAAPLELFLTGMFSTIDALVDRPLDEALDEIGLGDQVADAIRGDDSVLSAARRLAIACERSDEADLLAEVDRLGLDPDDVADLYLEALLWADGTMGLRRARS